MSYQVLARKYRPQNFQEVVGQEHVTRTLANAIDQDRVHHAYLLTGVRGTGKTSLARIFAKSLNCEKGPTSQPCNSCSNCESINKGNFLDVIEIDGASNTSVDSVRELREQVKYLPAAGKYKIYIIDEVHMLSTSAFNALLKTLEEPPAHVTFLFATTEVHKIPVTILSRCQRFDLRRISQEKILKRLEHICKEEGVAGDTSSLEVLSRSAEGSMRDAQSLLDMAIGMCGSELNVDTIQEMLGLVETTWVQDLTRDCFEGRTPEALAKVLEIYNRGYDLRQVALQWVDYLHDLTLLKAAGKEALSAELTSDQLKVMETTVAAVDLDDLQVAFQNVYRASDQIFRSDSPKILFDLLLVRMVHGSPFQSLGQVIGKGEIPQIEKPPSVRRSEAAVRPILAASAPKEGPAPSPPRETPPQNSSKGPSGMNRDLLDKALKKQPPLRAILDHSLATHMDEGLLTVTFEKGSMWVDMFKEKRSLLAHLLEKEIGSPVQVRVMEQDKIPEAENDPGHAATKIPDDPVVKQAVEILNATVKEVKKY